MNLVALPIDPYIDQIRTAVRQAQSVILEAPPGTGKTTRVAPCLLQVPTLEKVVALVQPRRIAARAAAARIASERGSRLGSEIGYQVRFDSRVGPETRLISMTPGILLRRIQSDPALERFSAVVLDEFHERSQEMDLVLGMVRQLQLDLRPDLRIVVMSATLDTKNQLATYLGSPCELSIPAESFPVQVRHVRFPTTGRMSVVRRIVESTVSAVREAVQIPDGDILVFLPGVGEIMQVRRGLRDIQDRPGWQIHTLFGDMPADQQDRVLIPGDSRKIILSTNIAETSLTIEGVRIVVDSGWARVQRFDPATGLDALNLESISQASATQRKGRAGRTQPGICYRLWDEVTDRSRPEQLEPEVLRSDLAGAILQLFQWGENPESFPWLTRPSKDSITQAIHLLELLGAVDQGAVTPLGNILLKFPLHPRLARLLIEAHGLSIPAAGAMAAAMLSERELFLRPDSTPQAGRLTRGQAAPLSRRWACDLTTRIGVWNQFCQDGNLETQLGTINQGAARNLARVSQQFLQIVDQELGPVSESVLETQLQQALLAAFPDRLAKRRSATSPRGLMVGGKGVQLESSSGVQSELFLCLDVAGGGVDASVRMASGIEPTWLTEQWLRTADERFFHPTQQSVVARRRTYWLDLMLDEQPVTTPLDLATASMLATEAARQIERLLPPKDKSLHSLISRIRWLSQAMPDVGLPKWEPESLASSLADWCVGLRSLAEVKQLPWKSYVDSLLTVEQRRILDSEAPESVTLPTGRTVFLEYQPGKPPILAARIQELFGWSSTPKLAGARIPLTLHLLAPNQRCQQITDDLASFWKNTYPIVRKELRGRYPKHDWPENPLGN
jgi:ATP-dependent helicase HrpB